jgi:hypothetical protein
MRKHPNQSLTESIILRLPILDRERLRTMPVELNLEQAEIARRALHVGLKSFAGVTLPGGKTVDDQPKDCLTVAGKFFNNSSTNVGQRNA